MNYNSTDRQGVQWVGLKTAELNWIFREQPTDDWGIDGLLEVVTEGKVTGRLTAVQIKSGLSWFSEETNNAFIFRGEMRHLDYWQGHSLPVIVIIYNTETKQGYWQIVKNEFVEVLERGWKMAIPKSNTYGVGSYIDLNKFALPKNELRIIWDDIASSLNGFSRGFTHFHSRISLFYASLFSAEKEICIITYTIDNDLLDILAIISKTVSVRILLSINQEEACTRIEKLFPSISIKINPGVIHYKAVAIDQAFLIKTSSSFTSSSLKNSLEDDYATTALREIKMFKTSFDKEWST